MNQRISRDDLYMRLAHDFALRSTCARGQVGCVLVRDNHVIGAGYNGAPPGMPHCLDVGCGGGIMVPEEFGPHRWRDKEEFPNGCTRAIHAELNAVAFSARHGVSTEGAELYCTHGACVKCAQALASAGIVRVVFETPYRDPAGVELLEEAGIGVLQYGS